MQSILNIIYEMHLIFYFLIIRIMKKIFKIIFWIITIAITVLLLWAMSFSWFDSGNKLKNDLTKNHNSKNPVPDLSNI